MINVMNFLEKKKMINNHILNEPEPEERQDNKDLEQSIHYEEINIQEKFDKKFNKNSRNGLAAFINIEMHPKEINTHKYEVGYLYFEKGILYILVLNKEKIYDYKSKRLDVKVPKNFVGRVIGKDGRNIKEIKKNTGIRLNIKY